MTLPVGFISNKKSRRRVNREYDDSECGSPTNLDEFLTPLQDESVSVTCEGSGLGESDTNKLILLEAQYVGETLMLRGGRQALHKSKILKVNHSITFASEAAKALIKYLSKRNKRREEILQLMRWIVESRAIIDRDTRRRSGRKSHSTTVNYEVDKYPP